MPKENLIYLADSAHTPYGSKSEFEIEQRVLEIAGFLYSKNVKALVVACNTATAAAVNTLRDKFNIPVIGLEPALKPAIENSANGRVGVLATEATLNSQKYLELKNRYLTNESICNVRDSKYHKPLEIIEQASTLFVELVEESPLIGESEFLLIKEELALFRTASVDSLVLGCTHYPFLAEAISKIMGPNVALFESSLPVAKELQRRISDRLNQQSKLGTIEYFSTAPKIAQEKFDRLLGISNWIQQA